MAAKLQIPKINANPKLPTIASTNLPGRESSTRYTGGPIAANKATTTAAASNTPPAAAPATAPGTPAPQPVSAPATDPTVAATAAAVAGVAPRGLTPDQLTAFDTAWNNYQGSKNSDNAQLAQAPINEANTIANDKAAYVANTETAQAGAASRGLFNSSIKDGALVDIAATQAINDFAAAGQLSTLTTAINADITRLTNNWGSTAVGAVGDAVINGQNVPVAPDAAAPAAAAPGAAAGTTIHVSTPGVGAAGASSANKDVAKQKAKEQLGAGLTNAGRATMQGAGRQTYGALS